MDLLLRRRLMMLQKGTIEPYGVFIIDIYGRLYSPTEWSDENIADGILVHTDTQKFIIKDVFNSRVGTNTGSYSGATYTLEEALNVTDGIIHTNRLVDFIKNTQKMWGLNEWQLKYDELTELGERIYVPTLQQINTIVSLKTEIDNCLERIGITKMAIVRFVTSVASANLTRTWWFYHTENSSFMPMYLDNPVNIILIKNKI